MRSFLIILVALAVTALFAVSAPAQQYFHAVIDGLQEVPPNASPATGLGCFVLNPDSTLDYLVTFSGLVGVEQSAHIHGPAPVGVNAGVQFPFPALGSPKMGTFGPLSAAQVTDLSSGLYYVNIHTDVYAGGEIRGQILPTQDPCVVATEPTTWGRVKALYE